MTGGLALVGTVWAGGDAAPLRDHVVLIDPAGRVDRIGPLRAVDVPGAVRRLGGPDAWIGPGIVDAHVHVAFGAPQDALRYGVVALRDLGAPPVLAAAVRTSAAPPPGSPHVRVAGPLLTAPGGYPSRSWGSRGFARFVASADEARAAVRDLVGTVDVVKVALEPAGGQPTPSPDVVRAVVDAAHEAGLRVTAHALTSAMVTRALDAGVDELCHTPVEPMTSHLVERVAAAGIPVVSTIETLSGGRSGAPANAAALVAAGVPLVYGTDLGNVGTSPGADPRELHRLADAGLGGWGALRAATTLAAELVLGAGAGRIVAGEPATLVMLPRDPVADPSAWRDPGVVAVAGAFTTSAAKRRPELSLWRARGRSGPA